MDRNSNESSPSSNESRQSQKAGKKEAGLTLPIQRVLKDNQGRAIEAKIVHRSATQITFVLKSNNKTFDWPIAKLSEVDRSFVQRIPISTDKIDAATFPFLKQRKDEIKRLQERMDDCRDQISSGTLNGSQTSALRGTIKRLEESIRKIEAQIALQKK